MPLSIRLIVAACLALGLGAGCEKWALNPKGHSPLAGIEPTPDSSALDVFFIRVPAGDDELASKMWTQIDEQQFPAGLRRELAQQGFRVGLIGAGQAPPELAKLLDTTPKPQSGFEAGEKYQPDQPVRRQMLQIHAGQRQQLLASPVYDHWPVLLLEQGELRGRSLEQAQGSLALKTYPQGDGRVRLELTPEIQYGQPKTQFVGEEGMWRLDSSKPKQVFDKLLMQIALSSGQMLVLTEQADRPGSLGHYFFTDPSGGRVQQKLIVLRFSGTKRDDMFNEPDSIAPAKR